MHGYMFIYHLENIIGYSSVLAASHDVFRPIVKRDTDLLARDCYRSTLLYNTSFHYYANNNRASGVEDVLGHDSKLAWKYRNVFEFFALLLLEFLVKEIRLF